MLVTFPSLSKTTFTTWRADAVMPVLKALNWARGKTFSVLRFYQEGRRGGEKYRRHVKAPTDLSLRVGMLKEMKDVIYCLL